MPKPYSHDEKCSDLARYFFPDGSADAINELAQTIQDAIEEWLELDAPKEEDPGIQAGMATPFADNH